MEGMSVRNHFKLWLVNRSNKRSSWIVASKFVQQSTYNRLQLQDGARAKEEKKQNVVLKIGLTDWHLKQSYPE